MRYRTISVRQGLVPAGNKFMGKYKKPKASSLHTIPEAVNGVYSRYSNVFDFDWGVCHSLLMQGGALAVLRSYKVGGVIRSLIITAACFLSHKI